MGNGSGEIPGVRQSEVFAFFSEVATIDQLCRTLIAKILPDGIHPSHFGIVIYLAGYGQGQTPLKLAKAMQVTKATMSHSLKVLEKRGFIQILPCEFDARSKLVYLTPAGHAFHGEAIAASARTFRHFLRDEHRETMIAALPHLAVIRKLLNDNREPVTEDLAGDGTTKFLGKV